jgi:hypothetical protein
MIFFGSTSNENECLWADFSGCCGDMSAGDSGACTTSVEESGGAAEATAVVGSVWNGLRNVTGVTGTD